MLVLPAIPAYFFFCIRFNGGALIPHAGADVAGFFDALTPSWQAAVFYLGWLALQAALQQWVPGRLVEGTELPDGRRLLYKMNGLTSLVITAAIAAALHFSGLLSIRWLYDNLGSLITTMTLIVLVLSVPLYVYGKRADPRHISGNVVFDYWMGTGYNPRLPQHGLFDLKFFCEARPGLVLWMLFNTSFAYVQYQQHGSVTTAMVLVCVFQLVYIVDYFVNEPSILTTMDIKHENFGFMLAFGDLAWVPLTYCLPAAYLVDHVHDLPVWGTAGIIVCEVAGLYVFRAANNQKNRFRLDPDNTMIWGRKAQYLETSGNSRLLLSGFWGWARHCNYLGDLLMAIAWSLPCLFASPVPYFYPMYMTVLLIHRERRDNDMCAKKYGADWDAYCAKVRWRIVPGIY
jgi:Delta14-sterol reductase